ncbi:Histone deacetylase complex subunit [Friedmanniomyces endolithicus]|nr:Histone deacetylase complex subunit [Friedmanniomyces endolithicus]KAK0773275.1 Histone deacetylase complex subunit [Friedmanniomyces endolithicus]KAK0865128.1 Histone deacetylase complex subunit [Friedmanniomyces endolithicus]KAK0874709.1 Histone deacetylase complex subunit [Friedmanniomyces endolithicus]KAK0887408.1 Histone deacetylase complex subunit [Friedmanniomyces endolithicus]
MPSPVRRSARAQPPPPPPKPAASSNHPSTSSHSSSKQDRGIKASTGPQKAATPHSLSSEDVSEPPRRSQRSQPKEEEMAEAAENVDEDAGDEEDITRCICGQQEYPGPPLSEAFSGVDAQGDDAGGLFIQCDGCSVWQHGGCVGIIEESQSPEKYYCEVCRPKLHNQHMDSRGQHYSNYLPLYPDSNRKSSLSRTSDNGRKDRDADNSRGSADPTTGRRRATMRSKEHDDEEEQLRRALEESKKEVDGAGAGKRSGKRAREDNDDTKTDIKRQRTTSESAISLSQNATVDDDSDEDNPTASRAKKARADAVQLARQVELREQERERERARADAAGRRQARAGRRRADEGDPLDETSNPTGSGRTSPPPSSQPPSPPARTAPEKIPQKKGPGKKTKKLGNNQYTKQRELANQGIASSPHSKKRQLATTTGHTSSGDEQLANGSNTNNSHPANTSHSTNKNSPGGPAAENGTHKAPAKTGKGKQKFLNGVSSSKQPVALADLSLADMERRVDAMSAFMQRAQLEMAGYNNTAAAVGVGASNGGGGGGGGGAVTTGGVGAGVTSQPATKPPFEDLGSMEMADQVSRSLENWKRQFGVLAQ